MISAGALASACGVADEPAARSGTDTAQALSVTASLAASCSGCHAAGDAIVSLDGLGADAFAASLTRYRTEGGSTVMHRLVRGYSDEQVQAIAEYLAESEAS
ncbi:MAG: hypothetical protein AAF216_11435 [Pseudomonadota bacterium]